MDKLKELKGEYSRTDIFASEMLNKIFQIYLPDKQAMEKLDLEIKYHDYGIYQLRQKGEFLYEGKKNRLS